MSLKLSYTQNQIRPIEIKRRGAPKGNKNASKPDSQKTTKVQGYISQHQLKILIALEEKMSVFSAKKRLRSNVLGIAIEMLNLLYDTVPFTLFGDETMNQPFLIATDENGSWTVVDMNTGITYAISPGSPVVFSKMTPDGQDQKWDGIVAIQLAQQFSLAIMSRKNDALGQSFRSAVDAMINDTDQ